MVFPEESSFRDPSGFLFYHKDHLYRQINKKYKKDYDHLIGSGLYKELVGCKYLLPHRETDKKSISKDGYKVLEPEYIQFISYPYEWCFSQLKDAALLTLNIQKKALRFGMTLKDASAYNVQFFYGRPIFIDLLSFEKYREGTPWVAYRQFCQHFVSPLALMSCVDVRLGQLMRIYIDGVPLDLTSSLLSLKNILRPQLFFHVYLHARSQKYFENKIIKIKNKKREFSKQAFYGLVGSLSALIKSLKWKPKNSEWRDYYIDDSHHLRYFKIKRKIVNKLLSKINTKSVWDLGANTGSFSRLASKRGIPTVAFDNDYSAVEIDYLNLKKKKEKLLLPLFLDLTNPSPSLGWENRERGSFFLRGPSETVMALAVIHHLAISNNVPLNKLAIFFKKICSSWLIIEFVPKEDAKLKKLLEARDDIFHNYTQKTFEKEFSKYFIIEEVIKIENSKRSVYLMKRKYVR